MKRINFILMAFALVMTLTQCKKNEEQPTTNDNIVTITLNLNNNNGSKVDVNPAMGTVDFESGDKIYVGSGGKYVGFLTHNGTNFSGNITNPTENQPLQLYFLGNVTPQETLSAGTTEECSVIISDQTEHLPVISCAASNENYVSGVTAYSAHLLNKCALVKFYVTTPSNSPICITGMHNKVTVDFANNTLTPTQDEEGIIMLPAGNGENVEKWAILLPQEELDEGEEGSVYSLNGRFFGTRPAVSEILENGYLSEGLIIIANNSLPPIGAINGIYSVSANKQVFFSKGNLQYQASTNTWRFADNQWDFVGSTVTQSGGSGGTVSGSSNHLVYWGYTGWIDLFGWATSGYNHGAVCYQPWSISTNESDYYAYGTQTSNLYDQTGQADWGYNAIINGGNQQNEWRTLTADELNYILYSRVTVLGIRYAKGRVNGINGIIILPDDWNSSYYLSNFNMTDSAFESNVIDLDVWNSEFENEGAVFLPVTGYREGNEVKSLSSGRYWTSSRGTNISALYVGINRNTINFGNVSLYAGFSVRLVQDY